MNDTDSTPIEATEATEATEPAEAVIPASASADSVDVSSETSADPAVQPSAAPADDSSDETVVHTPGMMWYVLRVASNKEERVRDNLLRKVKIEALESVVGRILVPTLKEKKMKAGVLKVIERKLYPGYVFVEMACEDDGSVVENVWFMIKETTGVGDFIGSAGKPTSMPEHDVVQMIAVSEQGDDEPGLSGLNIHIGDQVKISDGAFESYEGEVDAVDEKRGIVSVIISIFGRSTPVEVGYWQIEKVED